MSNTAPNIQNSGEPYPELVSLYIGLESTVLEPSVAKEQAISLLSEHFPSFTVTDGTGFSGEPVNRFSWQRSL